MFSQTTEYALRAYIYIARQAPRSVTLAEVADAVDAPRRYLAKILTELTHAEFLASTRGPAGGYATNSDHEPTLADVVSIFDESTAHRCLLGTGVCGNNPDCPVHQRWAPIARSMSAFFDGTTIADLAHFRPTP